MLAALNGLSVARVPGREDSRHDAARVPIDERVSAGFSGVPRSLCLQIPGGPLCPGLSGLPHGFIPSD